MRENQSIKGCNIRNEWFASKSNNDYVLESYITTLELKWKMDMSKESSTENGTIAAHAYLDRFLYISNILSLCSYVTLFLIVARPKNEEESAKVLELFFFKHIRLRVPDRHLDSAS